MAVATGAAVRDLLQVTGRRWKGTDVVIVPTRVQGIGVGREIAIATFDDVPLFQLYNPPITAIVQPTRRMGEMAVDMLLRRIAGERVSSARLAADVVFRASFSEARPF